MSKKLSLSKDILGELSGVNDADWRKNHNVGKKRKSRKESRRELRHSKKQKKQPEQEVEVKQKQRKEAKQPKQLKKKPVKSDVTLAPFLSAHDMDMQKQDDENINYYSKMLGLKSKGKLDDDLFADLDLDYHSSDGPTDDELKKLNELKADSGNDNSGSDDFDDFDEEKELTAEQTMAKLAKLKNSKGKPSEVRIVKEDELKDDTLSEDNSEDDFEDDFEDDETDGLRVVKESELGMDDDSLSENDFESFDELEDEDEENDSEAEKTMAKLKALKQGKPSNSEMRIVREDELGMDDDSLSEDQFSEDEEEEEEEEGEEELTAEQTMAKLKALKQAKQGNQGKQATGIRIVKESELGMDDDSLSEDEFSEEDEEEMTAEQTMAKLKALKQAKQAKGGKQANGMRIVKESELGMDDDSLSGEEFSEDGSIEEMSDELSGDEEELTAEQTMAKLKALKQAKQENQASQANVESESESEEDENPYVPPKRRSADAPVPKEVVLPTDTAAINKLRKTFKSLLNRLAEPTLNTITNSAAAVFLQNSVGDSTSTFTDELLEIVDIDQPIQHSLITVYTALVTALYDRVGINFAAHFLQTVVERIMATNTEVKQNLVTLFMEMYSFNIVSAKLPYEMIQNFLQNLNETQIERILIILRSGGSQLRSDDPVALKEVILLLQQQVSKDKMTPRMRYLVDATIELKNNRQKPLNSTIVELRLRLRKQLKLSKQPLRVGLQDILDSQTRGKWWLVGASWKGNDQQTSSDNQVASAFADDDFGAVNWLDLARKQRLNTDVRRAVFVALMGAEDYLEACIRIDKLGLKNRQERDIPHVILHCLAQEPAYNPYYALVAGKQCAKHSLMKTFQFRLWDYFATNPDTNPQLAMHYGRFYAQLVHAGIMKMDILKTIDFLGGSSDVKIFLEVFFVTLYKQIAKDAEKSAKRSKDSKLIPKRGAVERDGKELAVQLSKITDPRVLAGIKLVNEDIARSDAIQSEKDRDRIVWAAAFTNDIIDELVRKLDK